jgi:acyl-CoA-binding protein
MVAQSAEFKKAIEDSRSLTQTPTNDELLEVRKNPQ